MVAGAVRETPNMNRNSAILQKGAEHKQLQPWRPRDGTGLTLTRLLDELRDALGAHGIDQASLDERLPTQAQIASRFNSKPQSELDDLLLAAKREFMDENKIIYDMLKPALIIPLQPWLAHRQAHSRREWQVPQQAVGGVHSAVCAARCCVRGSLNRHACAR